MSRFAQLLLLCSLPFAAPAALGAQAFAALDAHALAAPAAAEESLPRLAAYLIRDADTELEKTRVIYRWVTERLAYDTEALRAGRGRARTIGDVLRDRIAGCEDYAKLFELLAKEAGLEAVTIRGYAKGVGMPPEGLPARPNHVWNAVRIDGEWRLLDATWGAGGIDGQSWVQRFEPYFFLTSPAEMILSHFPVDPAWQLLEEPMELEEWLRFARPRPDLFLLGFSPASVREALEAAPGTPFVGAFMPRLSQVRVVDAPVAGQLASGARVSFVLESPDAEQIVLARGRERVPLEHRGRAFSTTRALSPGRWLVMARPRGHSSYEVVLDYLVRS